VRYKTDLLDQALQTRKEKREVERLNILEKVMTWLDEWGDIYAIPKAFVFGSVTRPFHFSDRSDVDVAVESIDRERYFEAIAHLSRVLEREVDLIPVSTCPFANRIRQTGIVWTATPN
jgi:hypothetical protein